MTPLANNNLTSLSDRLELLRRVFFRLHRDRVEAATRTVEHNNTLYGLDWQQRVLRLDGTHWQVHTDDQLPLTLRARLERV